MTTKNLPTVGADPAVRAAAERLDRAGGDLAACEAEIAALRARLAEARADGGDPLALAAQRYLDGEEPAAALAGLERRLADLEGRREVLRAAVALARRELEEAERRAQRGVLEAHRAAYAGAVRRLADAVVAAHTAAQALAQVEAGIKRATAGRTLPAAVPDPVAAPPFLQGPAAPESQAVRWLVELALAGHVDPAALPEPYGPLVARAAEHRRRVLYPVAAPAG